jgi:hypothetical protein
MTISPPNMNATIPSVATQCKCEKIYDPSNITLPPTTCDCTPQCTFCSASDIECPCDADQLRQIRHNKVPRSNACGCDSQCVCSKCICEQMHRGYYLLLNRYPRPECECDPNVCDFCCKRDTQNLKSK